MISDVMIPIATAFAGVIAGAVSTYTIQTLNSRKKFRKRLVALRFEVQSNIEWANNIFNSLNCLRDEAWLSLKNEGHTGSLRSPVLVLIARVYDRLHALNEQVKAIRDVPIQSRSQHFASAEPMRSEFVKCDGDLLDELRKSRL